MTVETLKTPLTALSEQFDSMVAGATDVCIVTVQRDGSVMYLFNDRHTQHAALIGALEVAKAEITAQYFDE